MPTDEDLEATLVVNVRAPQVLTAALAPGMVEGAAARSWSSGPGWQPWGTRSWGSTPRPRPPRPNSLAVGPLSSGPPGIRVNTVAPGATRTPVNAASGDVVTQMTSGTPAGRPGTPDEVAAAVAWLVSDEASYVHGALIPVDGGITSTR